MDSASDLHVGSIFAHTGVQKKKQPPIIVLQELFQYIWGKKMPLTLMLEVYYDNASNLGVGGNILMPLTHVSEALFA